MEKVKTSARWMPANSRWSNAEFQTDLWAQLPKQLTDAWRAEWDALHEVKSGLPVDDADAYQAFIKDNKQTVSQYVASNGGGKVSNFARVALS